MNILGELHLQLAYFCIKKNEILGIHCLYLLQLWAQSPIPGDNVMRYYRLAIPVTLSAYEKDLDCDYNNVMAFWQECEDFVNMAFVPLGLCFDVVVDKRLVMSEYNRIDENIYNAPSCGTELADAIIGTDAYDVGMWVMHRDDSEENSGLSIEGGAYSPLTKCSGYLL